MSIAQGSGHSLTLLASASRSANTSSATVYAPGARGADIFVTVETVGSQTLTFFLYGYNATTDTFYVIYQGTTSQINANGIFRYLFYPAAVAGVTAQHALPAEWKVQLNEEGTGSITYSVHANLLY